MRAHVVLALGAPPPADLASALPPDVRNHPAYVPNPWTFLREPAFRTTGEILVAGSGLTALDVIGAFARSGARNRLRRLRARSFPARARRRRRRISGFADPSGPAPGINCGGRRPGAFGGSRCGRPQCRLAQCDGRGLRPMIPDLWNGLDLTERGRFLRHVQPLFDPHRHRAPAALLAYKDALVERGQLLAQAARIVDLQPRGARAALPCI